MAKQLVDSWGEAIFAVSDPKDKQTLQKEYSTPGKHRATDSRREDEVSEAYGPDRVFNNESMRSPSVSVTEQNFTYLQDNIDRLFKCVDNLEQRLSIVLVDGQPESVADRMGYGGNTSLSENLAMLCRRTQDLHDRLEYLTARIDL